MRPAKHLILRAKRAQLRSDAVAEGRCHTATTQEQFLAQATIANDAAGDHTYSELRCGPADGLVRRKAITLLPPDRASLLASPFLAISGSRMTTPWRTLKTQGKQVFRRPICGGQSCHTL